MAFFVPPSSSHTTCRDFTSFDRGCFMSAEAIYVGIDVSQERLDVAVRPDCDTWGVGYDQPGLEQLAAELAELDPAAVVLEATGNLEVPAVATLASAGLPVVVVNPRQVRDFAKATGRLAKTDALDAQVLAHFAEAVRPAQRPLPDAQTQELAALTTRRNQVITMLVAEKNRLGRATAGVRPSIQAHIAWLERELDDLDQGIRQSIKRSPLWRERDDLLRSVPGVGEQLSLTLMAYLPELDDLDRKQIAALVGVAPINRDSGRMRGRRSVWGGRARVAPPFTWAPRPGGQSAQPSDPGPVPVRLWRTGKAKKLALTPCIRKLLTILNAMVKSGQRWNPTTVTP